LRIIATISIKKGAVKGCQGSYHKLLLELGGPFPKQGVVGKLPAMKIGTVSSNTDGNCVACLCNRC
jgi:hypothetical protein